MNPLVSTRTSKVYAYAQGPPGALSDLQRYQLDHCYIVFSWSPPFIGQLSEGYRVTSIDIMRTSTPSITASPDDKGFKIGSVIIDVSIVALVTVLSICLVKKRHSYRNSVSITENRKTTFNSFNRQYINNMVIQESSVIIYNIPIPVQDDRHEENSNDVLIRVQDDNPQSLSSSLPLYGDVLSRLKTPPLPSIQSNITNSGTNFQSSTCSIEREAEETGGNISKPLHCLDTSFKLQLAFACNSPPSDKVSIISIT